MDCIVFLNYAYLNTIPLIYLYLITLKNNSLLWQSIVILHRLFHFLLIYAIFLLSYIFNKPAAYTVFIEWEISSVYDGLSTNVSSFLRLSYVTSSAQNTNCKQPLHLALTTNLDWWICVKRSLFKRGLWNMK